MEYASDYSQSWEEKYYGPSLDSSDEDEDEGDFAPSMQELQDAEDEVREEAYATLEAQEAMLIEAQSGDKGSTIVTADSIKEGNGGNPPPRGGVIEPGTVEKGSGKKPKGFGPQYRSKGENQTKPKEKKGAGGVKRKREGMGAAPPNTLMLGLMKKTRAASGHPKLESLMQANQRAYEILAAEGRGGEGRGG